MTERERLIELIQFGYGKGRANENVKQVEETIADYLLENGVIVPPCDVGTEIKGEIVHEIDYYKSLTATGETLITKKIYTCDKEDVREIVLCCHQMTWEETEKALKGGAEL